jgi:short-subunit dehydrogenase
MNKTVFISGGTKGIGAALVKKFAENLFTVYVNGRSEDAFNTLKSNLPDSKLVFIQGDLSKKEGRSVVSDFVRKTPVDVLINNAGVFFPGAIHEEADGALATMIETNVYSAYDLCRAAIPAMRLNKMGHIFNICSVASVTAYANGGSYSISKFALLGLSKGLREELKDFGVRVTSVLPGATFTASWEGVDIPEDRFMPASDVADIIWSSYKLSSRTVIEDIVLRPQLGDI